MSQKTANLSPHSPPLIRATSLRGASVWAEHTVLGSVLGLIYDHAGKRVTGLQMVDPARNDVQAIPLEDIKAQIGTYQRLQVRAVREWPLNTGRLAVDTLTLRSPTGTGMAYIHDAWFNPVTGAIDAYEVGLLPRQAATAPTLRVPAELVSFDGGNHATLPANLFEALGSVLRAELHLPLNQPQAGNLCA